MRARVLCAIALAALAACSSHDIAYPAGWTPLATGRHGCPDLAGTWRVHDATSTDDGMEVLRDSSLANPQHASVHWDVASITVDADGAGILMKFVQQSTPGRADALTLQHHERIDIARCESGLATIERQVRGGNATEIRLGKDQQGRLVEQRVEHTSGEPLIRWGDQSALSVGHSTRTVWSRWEPIPADAFAAIAADAARDADAPRPRATRTADASPFIAAPTPIKAPTLPLPPVPPTRPGALPMGEAQAIVLGALPDSAVFEGMTPTPGGYSLRVGGIDAPGLTQLSRRLAIDGHFAVKADAPPAGASGASAPAPTRDARADVTLELVERLAH